MCRALLRRLVYRLRTFYIPSVVNNGFQLAIQVCVTLSPCLVGVSVVLKHDKVLPNLAVSYASFETRLLSM